MPNSRGDPPTVPADARLVRHGPGRNGRDRAERILDALQRGRWAPGGSCAKVEGANITFLGDLHTSAGVEPIAMKRVAPRPGLLGVAQTAARATKTHRQWIGARRLARLGVATAEPILLATAVENGQRREYLVLRRVPGRDLIHTLRLDGLSVRDEHRLARRVGEIVRAIDSRGLRNRDCKLSNLIRTPQDEIVVVDTVGVQRRPGGGANMLAAMAAEAIGTGLLPRRALLMRACAAASDDPKRAWKDAAKIVARKDDHTPRTPP